MDSVSPQWEAPYARLEERIRYLERWQEGQNGVLLELERELGTMRREHLMYIDDLRREVRARFDRLFYLIIAALVTAVLNLIAMIIETSTLAKP